ncbi:ABC transporter substrate-binding protein [Actinomadura sp. KC345]|uniref:ABC transporter substrate-binding protein n=1 Tax=Actinomadura sp. KC345 TaxID=2530371 RepID=UPI0010484798|nr:ABC transporter substrate-binding protein [Actinomadura sp. KC345]TDC40291.1 ABC transporter substrate-binding protein [Actinomadura sp. KC345]
MVSVRSDRPRPYRARGKALLAAAVLLAVAAAGCGGPGDERPAAGAPGVTEAPCPKPVNDGHGCIYLGIISDLSSTFKILGVPVTRAQQAFWDRVNRQGGIGGYDIDVRTHVRDNEYDPATHRRAYLEMKDKVLALAQSLGSPTTEAILDDLRSSRTIAVPGSYPSKWEFEEVVLEAGASYCFEAMNAIDYAVDNLGAKSAMAIHFPGDYGEDAASGAKTAAGNRGIPYSQVSTLQGAEAQETAIEAVLERDPDVVLLTTGAVEAATIVTKAVEGGFEGRFMGNNPTWGKEMLKSPSFPVMKERFWYVAPWKPYASDSPGHTAMRRALAETFGHVDPNNAYASGWIMSYALKAVLEEAAERGDLTRQGVYEALGEITRVDYEGMLPAYAGDFSGDPDAAAYRESIVARPDERQFTGMKVTTDFFAGRTAKGHRLREPCYNPR